MNRSNGGHTVPDWKLERYLLGELPQTELEGIRRLATEDAELRVRLEGLKQSNADVIERYPPSWLAPQIERRAAQRTAMAKEARGGWSLGVPTWVWSVPVAVVVLVLVVLPTRTVIEEETDSEIRIKGLEPQLMLYRKTATGSELLREGQFVRAGDVVQLAYQAGGSAFGVILSVDGRGDATWHLPAEGGDAVELQEGRVPLDFAYELDDAPDFERFYFITGDASFALGMVEASVKQLAQQSDTTAGDSLAVPLYLQQLIITLRKGPAHE